MLRIDKSGFSTVSLIVGVFMLALVVAIVMRTVKKQTDNLNNLISEAEIVIYINKVKSYLHSPTNCSETFRGVNIDGGTVDSIKVVKDGLSSNRYTIFNKSKKHIGKQKLKITEYRLNSFDIKTQENISDLGLLHLNIKIEKNIDNSQKNASRVVKLYAVLKDGEVQSCSFGGLPNTNNIVKDNGDHLILNAESISVKTQATLSTMTAKETINISSNNKECTADLVGSLRYVEEIKEFQLCSTPPTWERIHR